MAQLLFQIAYDRARALPRARFVYSIDEAQEHAAPPARRRVDHAPGAGVLRLTLGAEICMVLQRAIIPPLLGGISLVNACSCRIPGASAGIAGICQHSCQLPRQSDRVS